jgi:acyl-CoA thioesterase-1
MRRVLPVVLLVILAACSVEPEPAPKPAAKTTGPVALFIGDSLTAGFGVDPEDAWPSLLNADWEKKGLPWRARNAAISGETSAGVASEVSWTMTPEVKLVFVCIGGNDGLRGLPTSELKKNLVALIAPLQKKGLRVALAGMRMPPNFGAERGREFAAVFPEVARERKIPFMPFLLEGVAGDPALNQGDGIHPNVEGHKRVAANVAKFLDKEGLLK